MEKEKKNKNPKINKVLKISAITLCIIILFVVISGGTFLFLKLNSPQKVSDCIYVAKLEDGSYYIPKVKNNIQFEIDKPDKSLYTLKDEKRK